MPSRTACSTASWHSYIRVSSAGPQPADQRGADGRGREPQPTDQQQRWQLPGQLVPQRTVVMPTSTSPAVSPSGATTGATARTEGPRVPE